MTHVVLFALGMIVGHLMVRRRILSAMIVVVAMGATITARVLTAR